MLIRTRSLRRLGLAGALSLIVAAAVPSVLAADRGVTIEDFAFGPQTVTINVGDRVTWTNRDAVEHTATATNGSFDTGNIGEGDSAGVRFTVAGTYRYLCTPHPTMTGTVVVRGAAVTPPNTATAPVVPNADARLGVLALVAGLGFLLAFRRRRLAR
jgi:plastocyanin